MRHSAAATAASSQLHYQSSIVTTAVNIPILLSISLFAETACVPFCSIKCFTHSCLPLWVFHTNVVAAVLEQRLKTEDEQMGDLEFLQVVSQA